MSNQPNPDQQKHRQATLALWAIPGFGPKTFHAFVARRGGSLADLLDVPVREWIQEAKFPTALTKRLDEVDRLGTVFERVMGRLDHAKIGVAFAGDPGYPGLLAEIADAPPLLFFLGQPGGPRRRVAMVGSRHPDNGFLPFTRKLAREIAEMGLGIVSGAAEGVDRASHWGALDAGGETWAFLGSALDELDSAQAKLLPHFLERNGVFFSELPPGVRASTQTFPRRNRLISGASNAVLILRAGAKSGSLHTALAAVEQGRTLLALPGDCTNEAAFGANALIRAGKAQLCLGAEDVARAVGVKSQLTVRRSSEIDEKWELSSEAKAAYEALPRRPVSFDEVLEAAKLPPSALVSALCELELSGLVVQLPGKVYERV